MVASFPAYLNLVWRAYRCYDRSDPLGCSLTPRAQLRLASSAPRGPYPLLEQPTIAGLNSALGPLANAVGREQTSYPGRMCQGPGKARWQLRDRLDTLARHVDVVTSAAESLVGALHLGPNYDCKLKIVH